MSQQRKSEKIEEIELLRAAAIILTLIQHMGFLFCPSKEIWDGINKNNSYWGGVDLFFCISGFVIFKNFIKIYSEPLNKNHWTITKQFWVRRFFRIFPTVVFWVCIFLFCSKFFNESGNFGPIEPNVNDARAAIFNYSNLHIFYCITGRSECGPNPVYWSLSLEEQFYFTLPLLLLFPKRVVAALAIFAIVIQFPINRLPWEKSIGGALWFFRTDAIFWGCIIAYFSSTKIYSHLTSSLEAARKYRIPITATLISSLIFIPRNSVPSAVALIALVSGCLVFLASFDRQFLAPKTKLLKPLVWIGTRSFSIYIIHFPMLYVITEIFFRAISKNSSYRYPLSDNPYHPLMGLIVLAIVFLVSEINYRLIETPLRKLGRDITHIT